MVCKLLCCGAKINDLVKRVTDQQMKNTLQFPIDESLSYDQDDEASVYCHCMELVKNGNAKEAIEIFQALIRQVPDNGYFYFGLGNAFQTVGEFSSALHAYKQAVALNPHFPEAYNNLGKIYDKTGHRENAMACFRAAIKQKEDYVSAYVSLGKLFCETGSKKQALRCFSKALSLQADSVETLLSISLILLKNEEPDLAIHFLQQIFCIDPNHSRANVLMGDILRDKKEYAAAISRYDISIDQHTEKDRFDAYFGLGCCHQELENDQKAILFYEKAIEMQPGSIPALNCLGNIYKKRQQLDLARSFYQKALQLNPEIGAIHINMGGVCLELGEIEKSIYHSEKALSLDNMDARAHYHIALGLLKQGNLRKGWEAYEHRFQVPELKLNLAVGLLENHPYWNGQRLFGKTLLVRNEQGFGDIFQFVRYLPMLVDMGADILFETDKHLSDLLSTMSKVQVIKSIDTSTDNSGLFDYYVPLMSIPRIVNTTLDTIPCKVPYLYADTALVNKWRPIIGIGDQFNIGLNWQGNPNFIGDERRSIPLRNLLPIGRVHGVRLLSLQKHYGEEQLADLPGDVTITDLGPRLDEGKGAFVDTAAVLMNLDLLITSDTAIAHLAGALGRPAWVLLPHVAEWRWGQSGYKTPWYPTMRLFRQETSGDWHGVVEDICRRLKKEVLKGKGVQS